jgi:hypothetical protein
LIGLCAMLLACGATQRAASDGPWDEDTSEERTVAVESSASSEKGRVSEDHAQAPATPATAPDDPVIETGPRIGAIGPHVFIWPKPSQDGVALGNIRLGTSVRLKSERPVPGNGCGRGYYEVEPRGFVCHGPRTTLDLEDPYYRALHAVAPKRGALYPYDYAYSRGAPMYSRVPTPQEWKDAERHLGPPGSFQELGEWASGHEELLDQVGTIAARDAVPWFFEGGKRHVQGGTRSVDRLVWKTIPNGSMLAYARSFEMYGRVWLVTPDLTLVPADRVQAIRRSEFAGVKIEGEVRLPIAWNRTHEAQPIFRKDDAGRFVPSGETLAGKSWVMITGERSGGKDTPYWELRERPGRYLADKTTTINFQRDKLPRAIREGEKWIDARILPGTLTAYEGLRPVYATLFSPGKGGVPVPGYDHTKYATTQTGYFRFEWKEAVATMSNEPGEPKVLWFSDVPHIQYIRAPLAMHVAYWHEDYANPKSAECVNVSARDGHFLFGWTDPPLPEDWGAVRPEGGFGRSTPIMINGM